ncbi:MAG: MFS transporter [Verrucomicrobiia bacterium]
MDLNKNQPGIPQSIIPPVSKKQVLHKIPDTYLYLLKSRNYVFLLISQFLGAFADNFFLWLIIGPLTLEHQKGLISDRDLGEANAIYTCLLYAPYILLAPVAGYLSDRFPKNKCLMSANLIKIAGALIAMLSFVHGRFWIGAGYLIIGIGACFYSPGKYGVLPEIVPSQLLVKANGIIEMLTIIAVLSGFLIGAVVVDKYSILTGFIVVFLIYFLSLCFAYMMERTSSNPAIKFKENVSEFLQNAKHLIASERTSRILLGAALFWASGAIMKMNFQPWGIEVLKLKTNSEVSFLSLWVAIGVMTGSILAGLLHSVGDLKLTRLYGWCMGSLVIVLSFIKTGSSMALPIFLLILAGVAGGLFLIPINAALQWESHPEKRGKTIATLNLFDNLAMVIGGAFVFGVVHLGADPSTVFMLEGLLILSVVFFLKMPPIQSDKTNTTR